MDVSDSFAGQKVWSPFLSRYHCNKAKLHLLRTSHGLNPVYKEVKVMEIQKFLHQYLTSNEFQIINKISRVVLDEIFSFVSSHNVTQGTAYGTYRIKNSKGTFLNYADVQNQKQVLDNQFSCNE